MKKKSGQSLIEFLGILAVVLLLGLFGFVSCKEALDKQEKEEQCLAKCGIKRNMLIFGGCHCMTESGWEKIN